jgi:D-3-phosphoglycerate dehydrogenase
MIRLGILAEDGVFAVPSERAWLAERFEVVDISDWRGLDEAALLQRIRSVEVVVESRRSPRLPAALADDLGALKYLCYLHGSIKHLVDKAHMEAGLTVTNWGDNVSGVAEGAMALLLCMLKQIPALDKFTKTGGEDERIYQAFPCTLKGLDVGLYGFGPIGRHMARMLEPFGAKIAIYDPFAQDVPAHIRRCESLGELFGTCQAISIHCGLNDATQGSVNAEVLALLPQGGVVVNTARGDIIVEADLGAEVAAGRLLAGIDVIQDEKKWDWQGSTLAPSIGAVLTRHGIGGGKGYPPGKAPEPRLPKYVRENLDAYLSGHPLQHVISAAEYDLKT